MKHLKLYEQFNENDPFGEEIEYIKPDGTFLYWLKINCPDENIWNKITIIDCSNKNLTSLEGIENLVNLKILYCYMNRLTSIEGIKLKNLVNLEWLNCSSNNLTSIEEIENLVSLKYLICSGNQLTSLEGIEDLVNLKYLNCQNNQFTIKYKNYLRDYCKKRKIISII